MKLKQTRQTRIKSDTIKLLDEIAEMKIKKAIQEDTFDIQALVKNKRGISYNKEILYLAKFYGLCLSRLNAMPTGERKKTIVYEVLSNLTKMNAIC